MSLSTSQAQMQEPPRVTLGGLCERLVIKPENAKGKTSRALAEVFLPDDYEGRTSLLSLYDSTPQNQIQTGLEMFRKAILEYDVKLIHALGLWLISLIEDAEEREEKKRVKDILRYIISMTVKKDT
jgi:hypothetical protein